MRRARVVAGAAALLAIALAPPAAARAGQLEAGVGVVDATWHVGASAGQYASSADPAGAEFDPFAHATKNAPSYGVQSRLQARAIVVGEAGGQKLAVVKIDLYIPQDLLWRRTAQLLEARHVGIGRTNLVIAVTHDHSSPYYTSTSWGAWAFQDVFDLRAFEYYAQRMAAAVEQADAHLEPVRVGATVGRLAASNRNALGPAIADDGTPAGFPDSYTDRTLTVVRFDSLATGRPVATLVNFSLHPEGLSGNDLISADYVGPLQRMVDRATGGVTVWTQAAVGTSEDERSTYHSVHERLWFDHREYGQAEYDAKLMSEAILGLWRDVGTGHGRVPFFSRGPVAIRDAWFPGPLTHPFPTVSNCRTETLSERPAEPQLPIVGLPDCAGPKSAFAQVGLTPPPDPPGNPGPTAEDLKRAGVPVPDQYGGPGYTGLEEDVSVHLQAFRIGDVLFTVCSCEQWADQAENVRTRTDRVAGNEWHGFDWSTYRGLDAQGDPCFRTGAAVDAAWSCSAPETARTVPCFREAGGTWSCPDPTKECQLKGAGLTNTCRGAPFDARLNGIPDDRFQRMRAQVFHCANGWNAPGWAPYAESEPVDASKIKGGYTCDDGARSARLGYALTVPIAMADDYNGYIATYREYQRGDHYRKALTGWGPHASDYMATRMVKLARAMQPGGPAPDETVDGTPDADADSPALLAKTLVDQQVNDGKAAALGVAAKRLYGAGGLYDRLLPADAGPPRGVRQPEDVQRFSAAFFSWIGGSNYTDDPQVRVQRLVDGTWQDEADQSGEVPVTLALPAKTDTPAFLLGGQRWIWTAHFEVFVSRYGELGAPAATPAGTYRFVVRGQRRAGAAVLPYTLTSRTFTVAAWHGIEVVDLRREADGTVSFRTGPSHQVTAYADEDRHDPVQVTLGPIDYPSSYRSPARFVRELHEYVKDPAHPADPSAWELYCLTCSFRPWLDAGEAATATVRVGRAHGRVEQLPATLREGRWTIERPLRRREAAWVCAGDVRDAWRDDNGTGSPAVGRAGVQPRCG